MREILRFQVVETDVYHINHFFARAVRSEKGWICWHPCFNFSLKVWLRGHRFQSFCWEAAHAWRVVNPLQFVQDVVFHRIGDRSHWASSCSIQVPSPEVSIDERAKQRGSIDERAEQRWFKWLLQFATTHLCSAFHGHGWPFSMISHRMLLQHKF